MRAVTRHLEMLVWMPDQRLNWSMRRLRAAMACCVVVRRVASSAYQRLEMVSVGVMGYPVLSCSIHRMRGSMSKSNRREERGSPWRVPRWIFMGGVGPCGVRKTVVAEV
jgi:hypothetical protein